MSGYVAGGWTAAGLLIVAYAWRTILRGRTMARRLPDREKTWR